MVIGHVPLSNLRELGLFFLTLGRGNRDATVIFKAPCTRGNDILEDVCGCLVVGGLALDVL